jgi:hypothetical protein
MGAPSQLSEALVLVPAVRAAQTANQAFFLQWRSFLDGLSSKTESEISARSAFLTTLLIEDLYAVGRNHP